jgi:hypothetical protein
VVRRQVTARARAAVEAGDGGWPILVVKKKEEREKEEEEQ